jgi:hypothetical protein
MNAELPHPGIGGQGVDCQLNKAPPVGSGDHKG